MRSQTKSSGIKLPEVHGMEKIWTLISSQRNNILYPNMEVRKGHA